MLQMPARGILAGFGRVGPRRDQDRSSLGGCRANLATPNAPMSRPVLGPRRHATRGEIRTRAGQSPCDFSERRPRTPLETFAAFREAVVSGEAVLEGPWQALVKCFCLPLEVLGTPWGALENAWQALGNLWAVSVFGFLFGAPHPATPWVARCVCVCVCGWRAAACAWGVLSGR